MAAAAHQLTMGMNAAISNHNNSTNGSSNNCSGGMGITANGTTINGILNGSVVSNTGFGY